MRKHLFLLIISLLILITPWAIAAMVLETTVTITGGRVELDEPVTVSAGDDVSIEGYIIKTGDRYFARKRTDIRFTPPATKVVAHRRQAVKSVLGFNCIFGGDSEYTETISDVSVIRLGPGETAEVTWRLPEPEMAKVVAPPQPQPVVSLPPVVKEGPSIPDGTYLRLYWTGSRNDESRDWCPIIDPRYPVRWEYADQSGVGPNQFQRVLFQWELWGEERSPNSTLNTDEPSNLLGFSSVGQSLMLNLTNIPPAGEVTLYLLNLGVSITQAGDCPRAEIEIQTSHKTCSATLVYSDLIGAWTWVQ